MVVPAAEETSMSGPPDELQATAAEWKHESDRYKQLFEDSQEEIKRLKENCKEINNEVSCLNVLLDKSNNDLCDAKTSVIQLQTQVQILKEAIHHRPTYDVQLSSAKQVIEELNKQIAEADIKYNEKTQEVVKIRLDWNNEVSSLQNRITNIEQQLKEKTEECEKLTLSNQEQLKDIQKLLTISNEYKKRETMFTKAMEKKDQKYQQLMNHYSGKKSDFNLREQQIEECYKKLEDLTRNTVSKKVYEDQLKSSETNMEKLTRTTMRVHQDCIKYADYLQAIISAATSGIYGKINRPDVIDESAHGIIMDLLQGTTDELKQKYEYAYNVIKEKFDEIMSSRPPSGNQRIISNISTSEHLITTYEQIMSCFEKAEETTNHVVQLAKIKEDNENVRKQILNKSRELRHKLHIMLKSFAKKWMDLKLMN